MVILAKIEGNVKKPKVIVSQKLKPWFTIEEAREYISTQLSSEFTRKDLLHLVMNQEIKISWYSMKLFVTKCTSKEFFKPSESLKKTKFKGWTSYPFFDDSAFLLDPPCNLNIEQNGELREFICWLINPNTIRPLSSGDLFVNDEEGILCKVLIESVEGMHGNMKRIPDLKQYRKYLIDRRTYPDENELGFTLSDLKEFVPTAKTSIEEGQPSNTKEKESIYKLIQLLLLHGYDYNPSPVSKTYDEMLKLLKKENYRVRKDILVDLEKHKISLHEDTVKKYMKAAIDNLDRSKYSK